MISDQDANQGTCISKSPSASVALGSPVLCKLWSLAHYASDGKELLNTFVEIAASATVSDRLTRKFRQIASDIACNKLIMEDTR